MSLLDDLLSKGLIEAVDPDESVAEQWLQDSIRHLQAASTIAEIDPSGANVLAYDAARKSVAAALLMTGHRVRSRPDGHQALAQFPKALGDEINEPALARFDRLRRYRNRSEYRSKSFGQAEVSEAIETANAIQAACALPT